MTSPLIVLIRGGGDLASGVAVRLWRSGLRVVVAELPQPLVVRRLVSFAETVYRGDFAVEGVRARFAQDVEQARKILKEGEIPVLVDPKAEIRQTLCPAILVDGRMTKRPPESGMDAADLVIGLGPGFIPGVNCHAAVETNRGHLLGRVLWDGAPEADTGIPDRVESWRAERVLRAPADGILKTHAEICDRLESGQAVAEVEGEVIRAPFPGVLRGLLYPGLYVERGLKIGDVDPRGDPRYCTLASDKSLAIGGGVLEAILSRPDLRSRLWG